MKQVKKFESFLSENENSLTVKGESSFDINKIQYGNPPIEYMETIKNPNDQIKKWFIKQGLVDSIKKSAPANDSETTATET